MTILVSLLVLEWSEYGDGLNMGKNGGPFQMFEGVVGADSTWPVWWRWCSFDALQMAQW